MENATAVSETKTARKGLLKRLFGIHEVVLIVLILLSLIGIGITDYSPAKSHRYWFLMVPIFAAACLILEWTRARGKGQRWTAIVRTQLLLWFGLLLSVRMVYLLLHAGRLDNENTGLIIMLLLAFATFVAGIHLGWRLLIVGVLIGAFLIGATYLEEYVWVFLLAAAVIIGILLVSKYHTIKSLDDL